MDGTLVDSIQAVESTALSQIRRSADCDSPGAWSSVALELGLSPEEVIAATHGRRAIDNLKDLKPALRRYSNVEMEPHVEEVRALSCVIDRR